MICAKCVISIAKNDEYLQCFICDNSYCYKCIEMDRFSFCEDTLLYKYNCHICSKNTSL